MFKNYKRLGTATARPVTEADIAKGVAGLQAERVSISAADIENGSPRIGDMIARNPVNHEDMWLIAEAYFKDNFEQVAEEDK